MRKRRLVGPILLIAIIIISVAIFAYVQSTPSQSSTLETPPAELPSTETPPNLLVIPEVPMGTLAIILACFFALLISQIKPRSITR